MKLSYQQVTKIIDDVTEEMEFCKYKICNVRKELLELRKHLTFLRLKKKIYEEFKKDAPIDFTDNFLTDDDVDDISSVL